MKDIKKLIFRHSEVQLITILKEQLPLKLLRNGLHARQRWSPPQLPCWTCSSGPPRSWPGGTVWWWCRPGQKSWNWWRKTWQQVISRNDSRIHECDPWLKVIPGIRLVIKRELPQETSQRATRFGYCEWNTSRQLICSSVYILHKHGRTPRSTTNSTRQRSSFR